MECVDDIRDDLLYASLAKISWRSVILARLIKTNEDSNWEQKERLVIHVDRMI